MIITIRIQGASNDALTGLGPCELKTWALAETLRKVNDETDETFCLRDYNGNMVATVDITSPSCDSCSDDATINCHDCDQYQWKMKND